MEQAVDILRLRIHAPVSKDCFPDDWGGSDWFCRARPLGITGFLSADAGVGRHDRARHVGAWRANAILDRVSACDAGEISCVGDRAARVDGHRATCVPDLW